MVDEQFSNIETLHRQNLLNSVSCTDIEMDFNDQVITSNDFNGKSDNGNNNISYEASTSSPESTNENSFNFNGCKFSVNNEEKNGEKKVHWNPSQVHFLLDCIEKRMSDFRRKSVHKSVWLGIGKEMSEHGDFSVEHCYNKWKNLRRDIRLFTNTNSMQKLSIRNTYIMERVQRMVNEIGYEGSSRKSSSPISPNFDVGQCVENNTNSQVTNKELWNTYNNLEPDSRLKFENNQGNYQNRSADIVNVKSEVSFNQQKAPVVEKQNVNNFTKPTGLNHGKIENSAIEESIISLLSDPAISQAIIMNPKLLDEILPDLDLTSLLKRIADAHPNLVRVPMMVPVTNSTVGNGGLLTDQYSVNSNVSIGVGINSVNNNHYNKKQPTSNSNSGLHLNYNNDILTSWPHQLYELLHSFRDEESRQMARLDQIVGYVQIMQESTKRRLSTINQLISLAELLIPQNDQLSVHWRSMVIVEFISEIAPSIVADLDKNGDLKCLQTYNDRCPCDGDPPTIESADS